MVFNSVLLFSVGMSLNTVSCLIAEELQQLRQQLLFSVLFFQGAEILHGGNR